MNIMTRILAATAAMAAVFSCGPKKESSKVLVLYYSQTSNTRTVAETIANLLGADKEEIIAENPYDGDFQATIERCMQEREAGIQPQILPINANLSAYDVIFLGYPVWFGSYKLNQRTYQRFASYND